MLISLGYSCQTRLSIDQVSLDFRRLPFDFNITTRQGLIKALETGGESLLHDEQSVSIFMMDKEKRYGIENNGVFFWHDYPMEADNRALARDWRSHIVRVNQKYQAIWPRFAEILRSPERKTIVLSNTQHNLPAFASGPDDFKHKFGLGPDAFGQIDSALTHFGAQNYCLKFLTCELEDVRNCSEQVNQEKLEAVYFGSMKLPTNPIVASSLAVVPNVDIHQACGTYDGGSKKVEAVSDKLALIYRLGKTPHKELWGNLLVHNGGYLASFAENTMLLKVIKDGDSLYFSNRTRWVRFS